MKPAHYYQNRGSRNTDHHSSMAHRIRRPPGYEAFNTIKYDLSHLSFSESSHSRCMYIGCLEKKYYKNLRKKYKNEQKYISNTSKNRMAIEGRFILFE